MYGGQVSFGQQAAGNARLIGDDEDSDPEFVCLSDCLGGARNELKFLRTGKEIYFSVQGAITVKENADLFSLHAVTILEVLCTD